jgi:hypothetical protein
MPVTRQQLLARAAREIPKTAAVGLVGIAPDELTSLLPATHDVHLWPARAAEPSVALAGPLGKPNAPSDLDVVLVVARSVSQQGNMMVAPRDGAELSLAAGLAELVARARHVVAVVLPPSSSERATGGGAAGAGGAEVGPASTEAGAGEALVEALPETRAFRVRAHRVITAHAVLDVRPEGLVIRELARGLSARRLQEATVPTLRIAPDVAEMTFAVLESDDHGVA